MKRFSEEKLKGIFGAVPFSSNSKVRSWQELKYGMFIHWGLYSELGGIWKNEPVEMGYSEQIQMWANISKSDYLEVAHHFTAEHFDPDEICQLAKDAGMTYVLMTTKHHDGFCMFNTATTDYNIVNQTPYGKDPLKLLSESCERHGLKFGIYFSLVDWHQGHSFDKDNNNTIPQSIEEIIETQLKELLTNYGDICEIWFDMSSPSQKQSRKFIELVHYYQPNAMINSRIWNNMGEFRTLSDNEVPSVNLDVIWQTPASIYQETWGYRKWQVREGKNKKVRELLKALSGGDNYLLNIGPRGDGSIVAFEADVLREMGKWIERHPEVLKAQNTLLDRHDWGKIKYKDNALYLIIEHIPENKTLKLYGVLNDVFKVTENNTSKELNWSKKEDTLTIHFSDELKDPVLPVVQVVLNGALEVLPNHTLLVNEGNYELTVDDLYVYYGYHERGNYTSMEQVAVRYTAYFIQKHMNKISLKVHGHFDENKTYQIKIGDTMYEKMGKQLNDSSIGPLQLVENKVTPIHITLANPTHPGEPLNLKIQSINIFEN
ncbi:alpha-L-fucosidase [Oceanobacillus timonensis]|uniref:alpha-L-fucosidase n=1 Tax=Oceanobacillus timonensis TaxID=1926285 RepID=UPI0009BB7C86|nr:alpha-L-fucosidase [Oceanobacillus timonensis]